MEFINTDIKIIVKDHVIVTNGGKYILVWKNDICVLHKTRLKDIEVLKILKNYE